MIPQEDIFCNKEREEWEAHKERSLLMAQRFINCGMTQRGFNMKRCGENIYFHVCSCGTVKIGNAGLCRDRLCPMCQWRLSMKRTSQMFSVLSKLQEDGIQIGGAVNLTLTLRNCRPDELSKTVDRITLGCQRLFKRRNLKPHVLGFARSIEVTYNEERQDYHPHAHILMLMKPSYYQGKNLVQLDDYITMWRECCELDYDPSVKVRAVKDRHTGKYVSQEDWKGLIGATLEVSKYIISEESIAILPDLQLENLAHSIANKHLVVYGGIIKKYRKALNMKDNDNAEPESIDIICPQCSKKMAEAVFSWSPTGYALNSQISGMVAQNQKKLRRLERSHAH